MLFLFGKFTVDTLATKPVVWLDLAVEFFVLVLLRGPPGAPHPVGGLVGVPVRGVSPSPLSSPHPRPVPSPGV